MSIANESIMSPSLEQTPGAILEAEHLHKEFPLRQVKLFGPPRAVHAVEDATFSLFPGRATALVGESG
ncbi:MAG TPA: ABC transporter ATP-binding protein, partial [Ktedonobacteraceae bacterium]|nr:ABC transporter ATP-binding protein [Ktedonobacteraceae bacterium]